METSIGLLILLQVVLIALNAVFASAEIAILSINETRLERLAAEGNGKARRLFRLTREPARFLATIQVAITLSGFLGSAFAADNFSKPLVDLILACGVDLPRETLETVAVIVITLILSYFTLVFGELVPKRLAMKKSEQIAMGISGLVSGISVAFKPIVALLALSTNGILRLCGVDPHEAEDEVSEEEIRMMVDAGSQKGTIAWQEKEFIQNVFEFNDITAGDIATHRTDVTVLWLEDSDAAWAGTIHSSRHTRYPVCDGSADNIVGILNAKDYFRLPEQTREHVLAGAVHPAYFVPETIKADVLFRNMKSSRSSMAVVLDEYGGMVGIVTFYDLIEELVGELNDEPEDQNDPEPQVRPRGEACWELVGNVSLCDLEAATGVSLPAGDYDTVTGLVFDRLGSIPGDGPQNIDLNLPELRIHIDRIRAHQVESATISRKEALPEKATPV